MQHTVCECPSPRRRTSSFSPSVSAMRKKTCSFVAISKLCFFPVLSSADLTVRHPRKSMTPCGGESADLLKYKRGPVALLMYSLKYRFRQSRIHSDCFDKKPSNTGASPFGSDSASPADITAKRGGRAGEAAAAATRQKRHCSSRIGVLR